MRSPLVERRAASHRALITDAVARCDFMRRSPFTVGGPAGHKEWLHFVVHTPTVDALVNFSLVDDVRDGASPGAELARIVVLIKTDRWHGTIELFPAEQCWVKGGGIDLRFGLNQVVFENGEFHIQVALERERIHLKLRLIPLVLPALSNSIRLELDDRPINWMVLPRLAASGTIEVDGRSHSFVGQPAYHDHNWGRFYWGRDFVWEWGYCLPLETENPWTVVFVRLSDRGRNRTYTQGLFLWRGVFEHRIWRGAEMSVEPGAFLRLPQVFRVPGVMGVITPGVAAEVPRELLVRADDGAGDWAEMRFESNDVASVCIPNDTPEVGVTVINEVAGRLELAGRVRGEPIRLEGPAMFEFVRSGESPIPAMETFQSRRRSLTVAKPNGRAVARPEELDDHQGISAVLSASMRILANESPAAFARLCALLDGRWAELSIDGEQIEVAFENRGFRLGRLDGEPLVSVRSSRQAILAVVDGILDLEGAIWNELVALRGALDDLLRFHDALLVYLNGAVRSPSFPALLAGFRDEQLRRH